VLAEPQPIPCRHVQLQTTAGAMQLHYIACNQSREECSSGAAPGCRANIPQGHSRLLAMLCWLKTICFLEVQQQGCGTTLKPMTASQKLRCRLLRQRFWNASLGLNLVLGQHLRTAAAQLCG
jgi:hypothetical protein